MTKKLKRERAVLELVRAARIAYYNLDDNSRTHAEIRVQLSRALGDVSVLYDLPLTAADVAAAERADGLRESA